MVADAIGDGVEVGVDEAVGLGVAGDPHDANSNTAMANAARLTGNSVAWRRRIAERSSFVWRQHGEQGTLG